MQKFGSIIREIVTPLMVLAFGAVVIYDHMATSGSTSHSSVNGKVLGRSYAPIVAANLGDAWLAAADALEKGKTVGEAQAAHQAAWIEARTRSFTARVAPDFVKVLPEGSEPTEPARRAEVIKLWRDFAAGLKGVR